MAGCCNNGQTSGSVSFDDVIKTRRSVRSYDATKTISEAEVRELLASTERRNGRFGEELHWWQPPQC